MKRLILIVINRGPDHLPRVLGFVNPRIAQRRAQEIAFVHDAHVEDKGGDANASVLYVDASNWYQRVHN